MTRLITLTSKASKAEVSGQRGQLVDTLTKMGADKKPVEFSDLRKRIKGEPKRLRFNVRSLAADKLVTVKVKKQTAEKAAA